MSVTENKNIDQRYLVHTQFFDCLSILTEIKYNITERIICKTFKAYHASFTIRKAFKLLKSSHDSYHHVIILLQIIRNDQVL